MYVSQTSSSLGTPPSDARFTSGNASLVAKRMLALSEQNLSHVVSMAPLGPPSLFPICSLPMAPMFSPSPPFYSAPSMLDSVISATPSNMPATITMPLLYFQELIHAKRRQEEIDHLMDVLNGKIDKLKKNEVLLNERIVALSEELTKMRTKTIEVLRKALAQAMEDNASLKLELRKTRKLKSYTNPSKKI